MEPHLAQYSANFPPKKQWNTAILLGRDCSWAMRHKTVNDPEKDENLMMEETPLGWTLTGPKPTVNPQTHRPWQCPMGIATCGSGNPLEYKVQLNSCTKICMLLHMRKNINSKASHY